MPSRKPEEAVANCADPEMSTTARKLSLAHDDYISFTDTPVRSMSRLFDRAGRERITVMSERLFSDFGAKDDGDLYAEFDADEFEKSFEKGTKEKRRRKGVCVRVLLRIIRPKKERGSFRGWRSPLGADALAKSEGSL